MNSKRVGLYLRVSTGDQTVESQRQALTEAINRRQGWNIVDEFGDHGISGAKGRDQRPAFDRLLKDAIRRKLDVVAAWSVDRLGRSLQDLVGFLNELKGAGCDLYLEQQAIDTTTPAGRAMFQMLGVFAEFERAIIQDRIHAGIARARVRGTRSGRPFGRPRIPDETERAIRSALADGKMGMLKISAAFGVGSGTVQRIKAEMRAVAATD